jgi:hypothetical protein
VVAITKVHGLIQVSAVITSVKEEMEAYHSYLLTLKELPM